MHALPIQDGSSLTLPAWIYQDAEFLALERDRIFLRGWQLVCHLSDIPAAGSYCTFELLGEIAVVVRGEDGLVRAFHNVCRHRAARLLDGDTGRCGRRITCPYHAWSYALDGRLVGVPYREQYDGIDPEAGGLVPIESATALGFVFIRFVSGGDSLESMLAPARAELSLYRPEALEPVRRLGVSPLATNWKNGVDNYVDALHVRVAHPGLDSLVGDSYGLEVKDGANRLWGAVESLGRAGPSVRAYVRCLPPVEHLPETHRRSWVYYQLWPNLAFNLYPDLVEFMQFIPVAPDRCILRDAAYGIPDGRREMRVARKLNLRVNRQVGREDRDLIERVQAGMGSRSYQRGPLGRNEVCLRNFARRMRQTLPVSTLVSPPERGSVARVNDEMTPGG